MYVHYRKSDDTTIFSKCSDTNRQKVPERSRVSKKYEKIMYQSKYLKNNITTKIPRWPSKMYITLQTVTKNEN